MIKHIRRDTQAHWSIVTASMVLLTGQLTGGCAAPTLFTDKPEPASQLDAAQTSLLLVAVRMPKIDVTVVGPPQQVALMGEQAVAQEEARHRAFGESVLEGLSSSGVEVLPETDAGKGPMPPGTRLLRVDVTELPTVTDDRSGVAVTCIFFGSITAGLAHLGCIGARNRITQTARFDVRLYDVSGATTERIERKGELVRVLDTSDMRPQYRKTHEVKVVSGHHVMKAPS
ncbi:MAG: hypothetical protein ACOCXM_11650, partial [Myxococcota bacterium]